MRTLVIGAGFLGSKIQDFFSQKGASAFATSFSGNGSEPLDILDRKSLEKIFSEKKPAETVLCASMSNVDECEKFPAKAKAVNVNGTLNVFNACVKHRSRLVFVSTDYVFGGREGNYAESDETNPLQVYGRTKLEAEKIVLGEPDNLVVRVSTLYGASRVKKITFHSSVVEKLSARKEILAAFDQATSPTLIDDVANSVFSLLEKNKGGVFHCAGMQAATRHEFAVIVAKKYGLDSSLVKGVSVGDLGWTAERPTDSSLSIKKLNSQQVFMKNIGQGLDFVLKNS